MGWGRPSSPASPGQASLCGWATERKEREEIRRDLEKQTDTQVTRVRFLSGCHLRQLCVPADHLQCVAMATTEASVTACAGDTAFEHRSIGNKAPLFLRSGHNCALQCRDPCPAHHADLLFMCKTASDAKYTMSLIPVARESRWIWTELSLAYLKKTSYVQIILEVSFSFALIFHVSAQICQFF